MTNASFLEIVQTLAALVGAALTCRAMIEADLNLVAQNRSGMNGNRLLIAQKNVRVERCVLGVQVCMFLAGLASLFIPPLPTGQGFVATRLVNSVILMYLSYRNWLDDRITIPSRSRRASDPTSGAAIAAAAQQAASVAQVEATAAQTTASVAQDKASVAQDVATEARLDHIEAEDL